MALAVREAMVLIQVFEMQNANLVPGGETAMVLLVVGAVEKRTRRNQEVFALELLDPCDLGE